MNRTILLLAYSFLFLSTQVAIDKGSQPGLSDNARRDMRGDVDRTYAAYFPLVADKDVCFELGRVLMGLKVRAGGETLLRVAAAA